MPLALILFGFPAAAAGSPRLAVVIDDFGLTYPKNVPDEKWMALRYPLTYAVMPESPRSTRSARETAAAGQELILHFPFDPFLSLELPKDGLSERDLKKVEALFEKSLKQVPGVVGLNNHRSYKATRHRPLMRAFMEKLKARGGLYFLDSKVSGKSVAYEEARRAGLATAENSIFIDTAEIHDKPFCQKMLRRAAALARRRGQAIAIGHHYFHGTYECLIEELPKLQAEGIELVFASKLLDVPQTDVAGPAKPAKKPKR